MVRRSIDHDAWPVALLTAVWLLAIATVNPSGSFPINDDWSYAFAVRTLVQTHRWQLTDWTSMPLATQMLWGALFCVPFGFSLLALRISTLVLAWLAVVGMYRFLRLCGASIVDSVVGALTLMFCPLFFGLAFTFMTDVPFVAFGVWACVYTLKYAQDRRTRHLYAAIGLLVATTLLRQLGLALAIGGAAAAVSSGGWRKHRLAAVFIVVVPVVALAAYEILLGSHGIPTEYNQASRALSTALTHPSVRTANVAIITLVFAWPYLGLFLLPAGLFLRPNIRDGTWMALVTALTLLPSWYLASRHLQLPLFPNVFHDVGLNPVLVSREDLWPRTASVVWLALTAGGILSAAALASTMLVELARKWGTLTDGAKAAVVLTIAATIAYWVPLLIAGRMFDRYLLLPLVLAMGTLAATCSVVREGRSNRGGVILALLVVAIAAVFDVAATHDYFSFDRARWKAVDTLLARGLTSREFNGGFEVDAWLSYRYGADRSEWLPPRGNPGAIKAIVSLGPVAGFSQEASYPFSRWIGTGTSNVYVLVR